MEDIRFEKILATIVVIILICALGFSLYAAINHHTTSNKNDQKIEHNRKTNKIILQIRIVILINNKIKRNQQIVTITTIINQVLNNQRNNLITINTQIIINSLVQIKITLQKITNRNRIRTKLINQIINHHNQHHNSRHNLIIINLIHNKMATQIIIPTIKIMEQMIIRIKIVNHMTKLMHVSNYIV